MQSDDQSGGAKRPRATIEGSAREISKKSADPADETPHVETAGEDREIGTADTSPSLRSVITISAISGISAVLLVFALLALMRFTSDQSAEALRLLVGADTPARNIATLGEQTEALRSRLATLERLEERLDVLSRQADVIEQTATRADEAATSANEADQAIDVRIGQLEARFDSLDSAALSAASAVEELRREIAAAAQTGASAAAVATRLTRESERIDALKGTISGLEQNLSSLSGEAANSAASLARATNRQSELSRRITALEGGVSTKGSGSISTRVAALESDISELTGRFGALALPSLITAHDALVGKASAGAAFARELAAISAQMGDEPALSPLRPLAERAVPTAAMLAERLDQLTGTAAMAADGTASGDAEEPAQTLVGRLIDRASRSVRIRRIESGANQGEIGRARDLLDRGDVTAAAAVVAALEQSPARDNWLDDARARIDLETALTALDAAVQSRLASGGQNG